MDSGFLRSLHRVLYEDAVRDVDLALRVAVLSARGLPRAEIAERELLRSAGLKVVSVRRRYHR